jgi:hypothetical protein
MAGGRVAIFGDADADDARYPSQISAILAAPDPPAEVRNTPTGLTDGVGIEHWADARRRVGLTDA